MEKQVIKATNYSDKKYVGLESVPEALEALGARATWGKVVVSLEDEGGDVKGSKL
jgi:NADPH2:quinone reductase